MEHFFKTLPFLAMIWEFPHLGKLSGNTAFNVQMFSFPSCLDTVSPTSGFDDIPRLMIKRIQFRIKIEAFLLCFREPAAIAIDH